MTDDDPDIRRVVRHNLEREHLQVAEAVDVQGAVELAQGGHFDLAVLDIALPDGSGLDLMARLRELHPSLLVIMLTAAGSESDRVLGLVSGADDYVVKPFSGRELAARVLAVTRRHAPPEPKVLTVGGLRIDTTARTVALGGEPIDLTRREFDLLLHLARHPGQTFSRPDLLEAVWASSSEWQSEATVTEHVRRLRHRIELDPAAPVSIVTVRGVGYRFEAREPESPTSPTPADARDVGEADLSRAAVAVVADSKVVQVNDAALALVGATDVAQVVGHDLFEFVAPRSVGATVARQESNRIGVWPRPEALTITGVDGREVLVELTSTPVIWEGQRASQVTLWDLSGRPTKVQELATGIRTDVAEAVMVADTDLRILSFNAAAEELYGWREDEVRGRSSMEVLPWLRDDATARRAHEAFQRDGRWNGEVVQRCRDGSTVTVRSSSTLLRDSGGTPVGIISVNRPIHPEPASPRRPISDDDQLVEQIRKGIERDEFTLHYQPVVSLDDSRWTGVEALVRWEHPERGLLPPVEFIGAAERSGTIVDLGQAVLDTASAQWRSWADLGHDLHMAVNLSGRQLTDPNVVDRVAGVMEAASMPPGALWLEVTETSLVEDLELATGVLTRLAELGANVSIDDFGTGWASLTYLREFPVHALKIDRQFVAGLGQSATDAAIVGSILTLGQELDLEVVAEGIETAAQVEYLALHGCRLGQGYHFARPVPPDELIARLPR
ncbi:MAG: EAL domain-containing protein [Acidimicrobiales bacterium]